MFEYQIDSYSPNASQQLLNKLREKINIFRPIEEDWTGGYGDHAPAVHLWIVTDCYLEKLEELVQEINPFSRVFLYQTIDNFSPDNSSPKTGISKYLDLFENLHCAIKPENDSETFASLSDEDYQNVLADNCQTIGSSLSESKTNLDEILTQLINQYSLSEILIHLKHICDVGHQNNPDFNWDRDGDAIAAIIERIEN